MIYHHRYYHIISVQTNLSKRSQQESRKTKSNKCCEALKNCLITNLNDPNMKLDQNYTVKAKIVHNSLYLKMCQMLIAFCNYSFHLSNLTKLTLGKVRRACRKLLAAMTFRASVHDGFMLLGRSGSAYTESRCRWKSRQTQSMMRIIRWGGFASLRTENVSPIVIF